MCPIQKWLNTHSRVNPSLTCGLRSRKRDIKTTQNQAKLRKKRSEERRLTGPSSKEPEEQTHLERTILNSLHQRMKHHGRGQSRASNGKGKYLGRWLSHPHSMLCTNWVGCIYEKKTPEQWLKSSQLFLPPLEGS